MQTKHSFVTEDGTTLTYYRWRQSLQPKPLLVLVHGLGSNHTRWSELIDNSRLNHYWDIIAPDLRGHAESFTRGKITLEMWANDLQAILNRENHSTAVFIGHSMGAHVLLHFFKLYPHSMRAMVLIDPLSPAGFTPQMIWLWRLRGLVYLIIALLRVTDFLGIRRKRIPLRDLRDLDRHARQLIAQGKQDEMVKQYGSLRLDLRYNPTANYLQYTIQTLRPLPVIDSTTIEVLIMLSAGSSYQQGEAEHALISQIPHATIVEIHCNHWPLTERPQEVRNIIETWLQHVLDTSFS